MAKITTISARNHAVFMLIFLLSFYLGTNLSWAAASPKLNQT